MTDYVIDSVALVRYLEDRLPEAAEAAFRAAESGRSHLYLPQIALGELIYIGLESKVEDALGNATLQETVQQVLGSSFISVEGFPESGWELLLRLDIPELHHRMLAAEALSRGLALVSNDPAFETVSGLAVVWE